MNVGLIIGFQNPGAWAREWIDVYSDTLELATAADQLGLDHLWLTEHHFAEDGYSPALMPIAAAIASRTSHIRIGTKVMLLPFHNPVRLAEDIATVDILSGGRIDPGFAAGYREAEFTGFGLSVRDRGRMMEEGLTVLASALAGEAVTFKGEFWSFDDAHIAPPPIQKPMPLWMGARTKAGIRRAARFGCHFQFADFSIERTLEDLSVYRQALEAHGRDPAGHRMVVVCTLYVDEDPERAWHNIGPHVMYQQNMYRAWFHDAGDRTADRQADQLTDVSQVMGRDHLVGSPEEVRDAILTFQKSVPFTDLSFWMCLPGMTTEQTMDSLVLFAEKVMPALHDQSEAL